MTSRPAGDDDIAVVGIGLRLPDADDLAHFRANLRAGRDSVGPLPPARAAATGLDPAAGYLPMGHLADITGFDHSFFGLSRREAALMDPQQRIALVLAQEAVTDAGYATAGLRDHAVAVVLSSAVSSYGAPAAEPGALSSLGNVSFGLPARIAHALGLAGPCYAIDTGCNSSLIAVHHASRELACGDAEYALAGGVSVRCGALPAQDAAGLDELVSPTGRCRAFDADADGTVSGEGGAVLLLTTLGRARADGAPVHAVLRGSAVLHNGRAAATLSTPSAAAQARVIARAWRSAGADPADAGYLEAHGSGTRLGDAVELEGLAAAFASRGAGGDATARLPRLPIGSVKTNIGHLDHAAGIAGLVKAVLSVRYGELYPSLHFTRATGGVDLEAAGLEVVTGTRPWPDQEPAGRERDRLAGVSSFSLVGVNAHCVVQQPPEWGERAADGREPVAAEDEPVAAEDERAAGGHGAPTLVAVSARSREALATLCDRMAEALHAGRPRLTDVALTLNGGRDHYEHRIAVPARDSGELARRLAERAARQAATPPAGGRAAGVAGPAAPKVVLLLSPGARPAGVEPGPLPAALEPLAARHGYLAGQLAAHRALTRCGVRIDAVLSGGASHYLARQLRGELTGPEQLPADTGEAVPPVDAGKLLAVADRLSADGPVVFVEPAPDGELGALLAPHLSGRNDAEVLVADADSGLPGLLGGLYERGLDLDWSAVDALCARVAGAADRAPRRLRLPGHPMTPSRCWTGAPPVPRAPGAGAPRTPEPGTPPGDATAWLRTVFAELLGTEGEITADTDYFALGGNSIIALQLIERVEARYGFRPRLLDVYEHPTVAGFAGLLTGAAAGTAGPAAAPLPPVVPQSDLVMSFGQERMWFHHQLDKDTTLYNLPMVSHVRGPVDVEAVRGMWEGLAARHEVLRSNFVEVDGAPALRIRPELGDFFRYADVRTAPDPAAAARELVREAAGHRFDLAADPLVRVLVVRLAPEEHVIQVTMHHAVNDGGSPKVFARELPELYAAHREGRPPRLAPLPVQYRDYARWQRDLLRSAALDGELDYWKRQLGDAPQLDLPTDHPRPARKDFAGALHAFSVPAADMRALRDLAARESVTLFVVLLAALYLLLARRSGQRDLVVGTPTTGRNRGELRDLIGFFNSTVALRADLSGDPELREVLHGVRAVVAEAMEHQEIPFDRVVHALGGERDLGRAPLFDVFYVHQDLPPIQQMDGASVGYFDVDGSPVNRFGGMPEGTAKFDLTLVTSDRVGDAAMDACLEFSTQLFTAATAAGLVEEYLTLLRRLGAPGAGGIRLSGLLGPAPEAVPALTVAPAPAVAPAPVHELLVPTDRPRRPDGPPPVPSATAEEPLGAELADALAAFASRRGPDGAPPRHDPLHLALITGWTVLLAWMCGQDDVSVGTPGGPLTVGLGDEPGFASLLARVGEALPVAAGDEPERPGPRVRCDGPQPSGGPARAEGAAAELALSWRPGDSGTGAVLVLAFAPELFDTATATGLAAGLRRLLAGLLAAPDLPVHDVAPDCLDEDPAAATEPSDAPATGTRTP
ncbi:polyketide synthase [Streptomyces albofaciens JCM 4342]|uniref:condensation domain-containing protein n=1 Tax=Streptomyces albofaciens TaxID=66866 RepID=UPI0012394035|nr:condensation domain-containing protein [Streptomyces albofaciens]KAA6213480.1 polyketide synthase [Streptomyces albofaciens JCM 4342]